MLRYARLGDVWDSQTDLYGGGGAAKQHHNACGPWPSTPSSSSQPTKNPAADLGPFVTRLSAMQGANNQQPQQPQHCACDRSSSRTDELLRELLWEMRRQSHNPPQTNPQQCACNHHLQAPVAGSPPPLAWIWALLLPLIILLVVLAVWLVVKVGQIDRRTSRGSATPALMYVPAQGIAAGQACEAPVMYQWVP